MRLGKCGMAVCSGVNLQLGYVTWIGFCKMGALSPDGRCKTFDANGDGFARSEAVGAIALMPLSRAEDISYVECHGTGTALGDPIETRALENVYGKGRRPEKPLILGAVKSNIGHTEGAAGIAGLTKVVNAMRHRRVPMNLHLKSLNPNIDLANFPTIMPAKVEEWEAPVLRAGISSFGFSGTNTHCIIEEAPRKKAAAVPVAPTLPADPLMSELSTRPETESRTGTEPEST